MGFGHRYADTRCNSTSWGYADAADSSNRSFFDVNDKSFTFRPNNLTGMLLANRVYRWFALA